MWYYEKGGQQVGPFSVEQVTQFIESGEIQAGTRVWRKGMTDWARADATELEAQFVAPPPLDQTQTPPPLEGARPKAGVQTASYMPMGSLFNHVQIMIFVQLGSVAIMAFFTLGLIGLIEAVLQGEPGAMSEYRSADGAFTFLAFLYLIPYVWTVIVSLKLVFRAMKNLTAFGFSPSISPGWAVGWYFIPVANLWMPFLAMREIWKRTAEYRGEREDGSLLGWWWALWIAGGVLGVISLSAGLGDIDGTDLALMQGVLTLDLLAYLLWVPTAILYLNILKRISRLQDGT